MHSVYTSDIDRTTNFILINKDKEMHRSVLTGMPLMPGKPGEPILPFKTENWKLFSLIKYLCIHISRELGDIINRCTFSKWGIE